MGILNDTSDGNALVLRSLCSFLVNEGQRRSKNDVESLFLQGSKEHLGENKNTPLVTGTITRWTELGLFADGEIFDFTNEVYKKFKTPSIDIINRIIRFIIFKKENSPLDKFWFRQTDRESDTKSADFTRGSAWLLLQKNNFNPSWKQNVDALRSEQLKEKSHVTIKNDYRYPQLREYMSLLGFMEPGFDNKYTFIIDPCRAIEEELDSIFQGEEDLDVEVFMNRLATIIPVLDGGVYRLEVENKMDPKEWVPMGDRELSHSLSKSLDRLIKKEVLFVDRNSDADIRKFSDYRSGEEFSRVIRKKND